MTQRDYILRMAEEVGRALAQIIYQRQVKDYQASHELIDKQFKQALGMGSGFLRSVSDETLLAILSTLGELNVDKCWLVATLLKVDGELYEEQRNENDSYHCYLKACNLFLEVLYSHYQNKDIEVMPEVEELISKLEDYELPFRTRRLFFWYFERTGRYGKAEDMLFDILETGQYTELETMEGREELLEAGEIFYGHLTRKSDEELASGNFSRAEIRESLSRFHKLVI